MPAPKKNLPTYQDGGIPKPPPSLKQKQKKEVDAYFNQPDPIGDFVRKITGANREKKNNGY